MIEQGLQFNASQLGKVSKVAYSSARSMILKLMTVVVDELPDEASLVPSSEFILIVNKRSRETPAGKDPAEEIDTLEARASDEEQLSAPTSDCSLLMEEPEAQPVNERFRSICAQLSLDETLGFDALKARLSFSTGELSAMLTMLELDGLIERRPGDNYALRKLKSATRADPLPVKQSNMTAILMFIKHGHHGVSRKCLQFYAAIFWCHRQPERWCNGKLFEACMRSMPMRYRDIMSYSSPWRIKAVLCT